MGSQYLVSALVGLMGTRQKAITRGLGYRLHFTTCFHTKAVFYIVVEGNLVYFVIGTHSYSSTVSLHWPAVCRRIVAMATRALFSRFHSQIHWKYYECGDRSICSYKRGLECLLIISRSLEIWCAVSDCERWDNHWGFRLLHDLLILVFV